jgi:hypothetical protein
MSCYFLDTAREFRARALSAPSRESVPRRGAPLRNVESQVPVTISRKPKVIEIATMPRAAVDKRAGVFQDGKGNRQPELARERSHVHRPRPLHPDWRLREAWRIFRRAIFGGREGAGFLSHSRCVSTLEMLPRGRVIAALPAGSE